MAKILGFALGYLTKQINHPRIKILLDHLKELDISGIEITFATKERLYSHNPPAEIDQSLRRFRYIAIHAPFHLVKEAKNEEEVIKQLDIIAKLYSELKAKNVIIHPDNLPPPEILSKYHFKVSIENLRKKRNITISKLRKIFKQYHKISFCLDTSHAYSWSKYETGKLIKAFKNKITQVHLSACYKGKDHQSLRKATKDFLFSIASIKKLDIPIIIEAYSKKIAFEFLKKEIEYIKKFLNFDL